MESGDSRMSNDKAWILVRLYAEDNKLLYVSKSPQIHQLLTKLWSHNIHHATVQWFHTKREQELAKIDAVAYESPEYNRG